MRSRSGMEGISSRACNPGTWRGPVAPRGRNRPRTEPRGLAVVADRVVFLGLFLGLIADAGATGGTDGPADHGTRRSADRAADDRAADTAGEPARARTGLVVTLGRLSGNGPADRADRAADNRSGRTTDGHADAGTRECACARPERFLAALLVLGRGAVDVGRVVVAISGRVIGRVAGRVA